MKKTFLFFSFLFFLAILGCDLEDKADKNLEKNKNTLKVGDNEYEVVKKSDGNYRTKDNISHIPEGNTSNDTWCYNDNKDECDKYGRLYSYNAAKEACKYIGDGWELPSDNDWQQLEMKMGCDEEELGMDVMGEVGCDISENEETNWRCEDLSWDNENDVGLNGKVLELPGYRMPMGETHFLGKIGYWWSSTTQKNPQTGEDFVWTRSLEKDNNSFIRNLKSKEYGLSVRCIRKTD
ncbi:fibrobacter succinogenes major paralogous domain-containing protein [Candidatus Absconditicoccus praedator]|uniref:fibrobacter succinogenes major paralogous domain-containing protein n=1 Tax=Candidatus Absconditicoccus praedator TaxID=2735562 RepID=UPI001E38778D|nr:fibrobacter succinogenes major paralogous domain-containing protein [Candidatus Absconditicoccus praedator]UFX83254.1 fibrobacter succinogenes major paralogous domain-containing protein [Candidatus Absconditicoccus praedator]